MHQLSDDEVKARADVWTLLVRRRAAIYNVMVGSCGPAAAAVPVPSRARGTSHPAWQTEPGLASDSEAPLGQPGNMRPRGAVASAASLPPPSVPPLCSVQRFFLPDASN